MDRATAPAPEAGAGSVARAARRRSIAEAAAGLAAALALLFVATAALATWGEHLYADRTTQGIVLWQARDWTPHLAPVVVLVLLATAEQTRRGRPRLVLSLCMGFVAGWSALGWIGRRVMENLPADAWGEPKSVLTELALSGQWPGWNDPWAWRDEAGARFPVRREVIAGTELAGGIERVPHPGALTPLVLVLALLVVTWAGRRLGRSLPAGPPTPTRSRWLAVGVVVLPLGATWAAAALVGGGADVVVRDAVAACGVMMLLALAMLSVGLGPRVWALVALAQVALIAPALGVWWQGGSDADLLLPLARAATTLAACAAVPLARALHRFLPAGW